MNRGLIFVLDVCHQHWRNLPQLWASSEHDEEFLCVVGCHIEGYIDIKCLRMLHSCEGGFGHEYEHERIQRQEAPFRQCATFQYLCDVLDFVCTPSNLIFVLTSSKAFRFSLLDQMQLLFDSPAIDVVCEYVWRQQLIGIGVVHHDSMLSNVHLAERPAAAPVAAIDDIKALDGW